jgi:hypothetical protein
MFDFAKAVLTGLETSDEASVRVTKERIEALTEELSRQYRILTIAESRLNANRHYKRLLEEQA